MEVRQIYLTTAYDGLVGLEASLCLPPIPHRAIWVTDLHPASMWVLSSGTHTYVANTLISVLLPWPMHIVFLK